MLSFIRKRLPSRDRSHENLSNGHDVSKDNDRTKQGSADKGAKDGRKTKRKSKSKTKKDTPSSSLDCLVVGPTPSASSPRINQSFSDVDYLPMMPQNLSDPSKIASHRASRDHSPVDCYFNPTEEKSRGNASSGGTTKTGVINIPITIVNDEVVNRAYRDIDHLRTKALKDIGEQRRQQQRLIK